VSHQLDKLPQPLVHYLRDVPQPKEEESTGMGVYEYELLKDSISPVLALTTQSIGDKLSIPPPSFNILHLPNLPFSIIIFFCHLKNSHHLSPS